MQRVLLACCAGSGGVQRRGHRAGNLRMAADASELALQNEGDKLIVAEKGDLVFRVQLPPCQLLLRLPRGHQAPWSLQGELLAMQTEHFDTACSNSF